jgi:hypothetical protein
MSGLKKASVELVIWFENENEGVVKGKFFVVPSHGKFGEFLEFVANGLGVKYDVDDLVLARKDGVRLSFDLEDEMSRVRTLLQAEERLVLGKREDASSRQSWASQRSVSGKNLVDSKPPQKVLPKAPVLLNEVPIEPTPCRTSVEEEENPRFANLKGSASMRLRSRRVPSATSLRTSGASTTSLMQSLGEMADNPKSLRTSGASTPLMQSSDVLDDFLLPAKHSKSLFDPDAFLKLSTAFSTESRDNQTGRVYGALQRVEQMNEFLSVLMWTTVTREVNFRLDCLETRRAELWDATPIPHKCIASLVVFSAKLLNMPLSVDDETLDEKSQLWPVERQKAFRRKVQEAFRMLVVEAGSIIDPSGKWDEIAVKKICLEAFSGVVDIWSQNEPFMGISLPSLLQQRSGHVLLPKVVIVFCVFILQNNGLVSSDLFRVAPSLHDKELFQEALLSNNTIQELPLESPAVIVAGAVLLDWLAQLPDRPLFAHSFECVACDGVWSKVSRVVAKLPLAKYCLMAFLGAFFRLMAQFSKRNGLTFDVIGEILAPCLMETGGKNSARLKQFITCVVENIPVHPINSVAAGYTVYQDKSRGKIVEFDEHVGKYNVLFERSLGQDERQEWIAAESFTRWDYWRNLPEVPDLFPLFAAPIFLGVEMELKCMPVVSSFYECSSKSEHCQFEVLLYNSLVARDLLVALGEGSSTRVATSETTADLVTLFFSVKREEWFLENIIYYFLDEELLQTASLNTLFRRNSTASRVTSGFLYAVGSRFLQQYLRRPLEAIISEENKRGEQKVPLEVVARYSNLVLDAILSQLDNLPNCIRQVCRHVGDRVAEKFKDQKSARLIGIGGVLFLRFFCPAVLSPIEYGIVSRSSVLSPTCQGTLVKVTSSIQCLVNQVSFVAGKSLFEMNEVFVDLRRTETNAFLENLTLPVLKENGPLFDREAYEASFTGVVLSVFWCYGSLKAVLSDEVNAKLQSIYSATQQF